MGFYYEKKINFIFGKIICTTNNNIGKLIENVETTYNFT